MQPQTPEQPVTPKRWPFSKKVTLLLGIGLLIIIAIIITIVDAVQRNGSEPQSNNQSLYVQRDGYPQTDGVSDPAAVASKKVSQAVTKAGQAIIQACNLLSIEDLKSQGIPLQANTLPGAISRTFNDGEGKAQSGEVRQSSLSSIGLSSDVNNCNYVLEATNSAIIGINVLQPFLVSAALVNQEISESYTPAEAIEGVEVFKRQDKSGLGDSNAQDYILRVNGTAAYITLGLPEQQQSKIAAVLSTIAKNFAQEVAQPSGISEIYYDSKPFTKDYTKACSLVTNQQIRDLSGKDASPLAKEAVATATGVLDFSKQGDDNRYVYVANECTRGIITSGLSRGIELTVETTSFLENKPAQNFIAVQRQTNPNNAERMDAPSKVGDEAVVYRDASGGAHIAFRKGRIIVDAALKQPAMQQLGITNLNAAAQKLTPIALDMATRVK
jgi:hypothetical protein